MGTEFPWSSQDILNRFYYGLVTSIYIALQIKVCVYNLSDLSAKQTSSELLIETKYQ